MVYNYSNSSGCQNNSNTSPNNPIAADSTSSIRAAHINELRDAVEGWYSQNGVGAIDWNGVEEHAYGDLATSTHRYAHINELRIAINKLRVSATRCSCQTNCSCNNRCLCNSNFSWPCITDCEGHSNAQDNYNNGYPGIYSWSNDSGCSSNSPSSQRISDLNEVKLTKFISDLRYNVDLINSGTIPASGGYNTNVSGAGQSL